MKEKMPLKLKKNIQMKMDKSKRELSKYELKKTRMAMILQKKNTYSQMEENKKWQKE